MMQFSVTSTGEDQVLRHLDDIQFRVFDLKPLGVKIGEIVQVDNMAARMLGVDKDGLEFAPLAPATLADPRRGPGPALAPMEMASRIISDLTISYVEGGVGELDVVGDWPGMPFLIYHVTGTRHMPARDPVGVRPEGWAQVEEAADAFLESILGGP
jgi:hypothetical protein